MIFDRSWYNRAGVERVMDGFLQREEQAKRFLQLAPLMEKSIVRLRHRPAEVLAGG